MTAGRRSMISCSAACSARAGRPPSSATNSIGGRVLEVGVGTGISLPQYAANTRVFGTDISEAMLRKAHQRVKELGLSNVEGLAVMDAEKLEFPDNSFDVVMAQYVVTAVPNPEVGAGRIRPRAAAGRRDDPAQPGQRGCRHAPLHRAAAAAGGASARLPHRRIRLVALCAMAGRRRTACELVERRLMPPLGHFSLIRFRKARDRRGRLRRSA